MRGRTKVEKTRKHEKLSEQTQFALGFPSLSPLSSSSTYLSADVEGLIQKHEYPPFSNPCDIRTSLLPFLAIVPSVPSRARNGTHPLPQGRMKQLSSKLGQLCHSSSSLSLRSRAASTLSHKPLRTNGARVKADRHRETMRGFLEDTAPARVGSEEAVVRKGGMHVLDRAANWAHVRPRKKRRVPPLGIPHQSVEKILSNPLSVDDEMFDTDIAGQIPPKGSFLEIRRSVLVQPIIFSSVHDFVQGQCGGSCSRLGSILLWSQSTSSHPHYHGSSYPVQPL